MENCVFKSKGKFKYLNHVTGVNKDGEKYVSVEVLDENKKKFRFIGHDDNVISQFVNLEIADFSDIVLIVGFSYVFNPNSRFSNWQVQLLGVD